MNYIKFGESKIFEKYVEMINKKTAFENHCKIEIKFCELVNEFSKVKNIEIHRMPYKLYHEDISVDIPVINYQINSTCSLLITPLIVATVDKSKATAGYRIIANLSGLKSKEMQPAKIKKDMNSLIRKTVLSEFAKQKTINTDRKNELIQFFRLIENLYAPVRTLV